ncbi:uncharacterized protein B0T15DRAFT_108107 [Chaetomium strumarium]|uniref:Uncharacterized protein n=1 Tax=Chaetomium strumarium TaxID=1170767 RepID=A0AAJ0GYG6_9PEZI|nr:hypothetical protein B0T15DRAFT_108107 [Chaetomium strumarium]
MPSSAFYTKSQRSQGTQRIPWRPGPLLTLVALFFLAVASTVGLSVSAVAFSDTPDLAKPGRGIAQSFVLFASILSLLHVSLHLSVSRKDEILYFDPPIPSFRHQLHAWTTIVIWIAAAMWAGATIGVAVLLYQGRGGSITVLVKVDMFACATGLLFGCVVLGVVRFANQPFTLPWISPARPEADTSSNGDFDDKTSRITRGSTSTDETLRGSPAERSKAPSKAPSSNTSRSTSPSRSKTKRMMRTRRYILEATPTPVVLSPLKPQRSGDSGGSSNPPIGTQRDKSNVEGKLVPSATESESFFAASTTDFPEQKAKSGPLVTERPVTPETTIGSVTPRSSSITTTAATATVTVQRPARVAMVPVVQLGFGDSPTKFRLKRKSVAPPVDVLPQSSGLSGAVSGELKSGGFVAPSPPPPPPPPPPPAVYYVPGSWVPKFHSYGGMSWDD